MKLALSSFCRYTFMIYYVTFVPFWTRFLQSLLPLPNTELLRLFARKNPRFRNHRKKIGSTSRRWQCTAAGTVILRNQCLEDTSSLIFEPKPNRQHPLRHELRIFNAKPPNLDRKIFLRKSIIADVTTLPLKTNQRRTSPTVLFPNFTIRSSSCAFIA